MGEFNNITKKVNIQQSSNNINLNLDAQTDIKDIKRGHQEITYIDGSSGETFVSLGKEINIQINQLTSDEFKKLKDLWKSQEDFIIQTERNESFKVRYLDPIYDMVEEEDFRGNSFWYGSITLKEI